MNASIQEGLIPPLPGLENEEPELAQEDDIPSDARPEVAHEPLELAADPEKGRIKAPEPGKPEHPGR